MLLGFWGDGGGGVVLLLLFKTKKCFIIYFLIYIYIFKDAFQHILLTVIY